MILPYGPLCDDTTGAFLSLLKLSFSLQNNCFTTPPSTAHFFLRFKAWTTKSSEPESIFGFFYLTWIPFLGYIGTNRILLLGKKMNTTILETKTKLHFSFVVKCQFSLESAKDCVATILVDGTVDLRFLTRRFVQIFRTFQLSLLLCFDRSRLFFWRTENGENKIFRVFWAGSGLDSPRTLSHFC